MVCGITAMVMQITDVGQASMPWPNVYAVIVLVRQDLPASSVLHDTP
jgi:hypothetical protein